MYNKTRSNTKMYCTNSGCSNKHTCGRYVSRVTDGMLARKYEEVFNGKPCIKFLDNANGNHFAAEQQMQAERPSLPPRDAELREHLVRMLLDNFDELFLTELCFINGAAYNPSKIAGRLVDYLIPAIISSRGQGKRR